MITKIKSSSRDVTMFMDWASDYEHQDRRYKQGSNPNIFSVIKSHVESELPFLDSLCAGEFLWNNPCYHALFNRAGKALGRDKVVVFTNPLDAYKKATLGCDVYDFDTQIKCSWKGESKFAAASRIYGDPNRSYELRIVPVISVESPAKLEGISKGKDSADFWAMHGKMMYGIRKDGTAWVMLPSCNADVLNEIQTNSMLLVNDLPHEEVSRLNDMHESLYRDMSVRFEDFDPDEKKRWEDAADRLKSLSVSHPKVGTVNMTSPIWKGSGLNLLRTIGEKTYCDGGTSTLASEHVMHFRPGGESNVVGIGEVAKLVGSCLKKPMLMFSQTYLDPNAYPEKYFNGNFIEHSRNHEVRKVALGEGITNLIDCVSENGGGGKEGTFGYCCNKNWHSKFLLTEKSFIAFTHNVSKSGMNGDVVSYFEPNENGKWEKTKTRNERVTKSSLFGEIGFYVVLEDEDFAARIREVLIPRMLSEKETVTAYGSVSAWI